MPPYRSLRNFGMLLKIITLVTHSTLLLFFTATGFPFPHPAPDWAVRSAFPVTLGCMQCLQHQRSCAGAGHPVAVLRGQRGQRSPSDLQIMVLEMHWVVKALLTNAPPAPVVVSQLVLLGWRCAYWVCPLALPLVWPWDVLLAVA